MKRQFRLAGLLGALAIVASACGGNGGSAAPTSGGGQSATPSEVAPSTATYPTGDIKITMWTKEGEADGALQFAKKLAADYKTLHSNVTIEVVNKDVEKLREEFQSSSLAGNAPDLLWTVADHIGPFTAADLLLPLDGQIDAATYLPNALSAVQADGKTWGVPISYGNQLMLYWNKDLAGDTAPADSDALVAKAKELTTGGNFGLVFNQTESFWLVPILGGFGGKVFADDGKTPTLNTDAMKGALHFMYDLKYMSKVMPNEADYNGADGLFKSGKAAFIINGDWTLGAYAEAFPDKLGVGPIPMITGHEDPHPYTAGAFFMVGKDVGDDADKQTVVLDFIKYATAKEQQVAMVTALKRLPGNNEAINDAIVTGDKLLAGAAEAVKLGTPQPTNLEMRCVFDAMTTGVRNLFKSASSNPDQIAEAMQKAADQGVAPGGECGPA
jgi:arabinogalactan oligomer/maltooligosaccharide transport system substrate-binding protein